MYSPYYVKLKLRMFSYSRQRLKNECKYRIRARWITTQVNKTPKCSDNVVVFETFDDSKEAHNSIKFHADSNGYFRRHQTSQNQRIRKAAHEILYGMLPTGYPNSVKAGYANYVSWQFLSMACSSASGVLSTQMLLHAMGLNVGAIPIAAALNWVIKDGFGQLGGIIFSSIVSTRFDANPKMWRMIAAISLDISTLLELLSPLFASHFLVIASLANTGKNISFLAASASRAAIHNSFVKRENLADITAKAGSQNILSSLLGMGIGVGVSANFGSDMYSVYPLAGIFMFGHLLFTRLSLHSVVTTTIDRQRLDILLSCFQSTGVLLNPQQVNKKEVIVWPFARPFTKPQKKINIILGLSLSKSSVTLSDIHSMSDYAEKNNDRYLLSVNSNRKDIQIYVFWLEGCLPIDMLKGALHAYMIQAHIIQHADTSDVIMKARPQNTEMMMENLQNLGWNTNIFFFEDSRKIRLRICKL